jgi:hypothetical protein
MKPEDTYVQFKLNETSSGGELFTIPSKEYEMVGVTGEDYIFIKRPVFYKVVEENK